ncbi:MAG: putative thiol-disulfide oxidoreductase DCC [bacterium]|nr:MAG: putative thiol-disulfide oxidoreductase DCC [bacterium]
MDNNSPVMLYDGVCGFCSQSVQVIIKLDKRGVIKFAPLQGQFGQAAKLHHPEIENVDSVIILEKMFDSSERVFVRSDAILRILHHLGGVWRLFKIAYIVPRSFRDFLYDLFARNRYKVFGKYESCMIPLPEVRARFIDMA